jgi:hypothetical protein
VAEDGWCKVFDYNANPNTPIIQWNDSGRILKYDAAHRVMAMQQFSVYEFLVLYSTYSANVIWYGDL